MGETVNVEFSQRGCDGHNAFSRPLSLETSGVNGTDRSTNFANINEKPIRKMKKKNKKKGKKNSNSTENVIAETRPNKCGQDNRKASYQSSTHADGLISKCICGGDFDFKGSHVLADVWNSSRGDMVTCGRSSNGTMQGTRGLYWRRKMLMHCHKDLKDNHSLGDLSQYMSCDTDSTISSASEGCNGCSDARSESNNQPITFDNTHSDAAHVSEHGSITPQGDVENKLPCHRNVKTGKENVHLVCRKSRKSNSDPQNHWEKRLNHVYVRKDMNFQDEQSHAKHNSCSSNSLLPTPTVSSVGHNAGSHRVITNKQATYSKTHCNLLVESSQWVAQRRCHSGFNHFISEVRHDESVGSKDWGNLKQKRNVSFEHVCFSTDRESIGGYKENLFRVRNRMILSQTEAVKVSRELHYYNSRAHVQRSTKRNQFIATDDLNCLHSYPTSACVQLNAAQTSIAGVSDCTLLPAVRQCMSMEIPTPEHVFVGSPHAASEDLQGNPACLDISHSYVYNIKQESNARMSSRKWIPVGRKDSEILKNIEAAYACNSLKDTPNSCMGKAEVHLEENVVPISIAPVDPAGRCLNPKHDIPTETLIKTERARLEKNCTELAEKHRDESARDYITPATKANATPQLVIGSKLVMKALNSAYKLQMVSESVQLVTGSPLAEFERLLKSATPVIAPTSTLQHCSICLGNQLPYRLLCTLQTANIPLHEVWSWYEKPGNYGLEVKAEDSRNLEGLGVNSVSFNAHFVPFLSAVQLFGHSQNFSCNNSERHLSPEAPENREGEKCLFCSKSLSSHLPCPGAVEYSHFQVEEISVSNLPESEGEPDDMELIFEFFEHEQPQQRKPLYDKVMELFKAGTSNHLVFGDPSKLKCMALHNLHPASWYSVAWYPIYRIPEGNFRASFLTYHSFGHLAQRLSVDSFMDNQSSVISPVLGLQSYNAQAECWFYPKLPAESSYTGSTAFNSSEILKERLRTLEESALLFARGCVFKNHIKVTNRQPDFEFFLSRKQ